MKYIELIPYGLFLLGVFILLHPYIKKYFMLKKIDSRNRLAKYSRQKRKMEVKLDPLSKHIEKLLWIVLKKNEIEHIIIFYLISGLFGVLGMVLTIKILPPILGILSSLSLLLIPYIFLIGKLQIIRISASFEGDVLISELLNNYKICYYNMEEAIEKTGVTIEDAPFSKNILLNLSKGLARAGTNEEIKDLIDIFKYSLDTSWGNILGTNIYFATTSGIRVTEALKDLSDSIQKARKLTEYTRRENNEAILMIKYLAPTCYALTIIGAIKYFGFTIDKFFYYQFRTNVGITWFTIICLTYIVGIVAAVFFSKRKMEL